MAADLATNYASTAPQDNVSLAYANKTTLVTNTLENMSNTLDVAVDKTNLFYIIGYYFAHGWDLVLGLKTISDATIDMASEGVSQLPLGKSGDVIALIIKLILLAVIIVGIFISYLLGRKT
jgi:hypothetical protein